LIQKSIAQKFQHQRQYSKWKCGLNEILHLNNNLINHNITLIYWLCGLLVLDTGGIPKQTPILKEVRSFCLCSILKFLTKLWSLKRSVVNCVRYWYALPNNDPHREMVYLCYILAYLSKPWSSKRYAYKQFLIHLNFHPFFSLAAY